MGSVGQWCIMVQTMSTVTIYLTFWPLIDILSPYGFKIYGALMDSSSNNHLFSHIVIKPENARILKEHGCKSL